MQRIVYFYSFLINFYIMARYTEPIYVPALIIDCKTILPELFLHEFEKIKNDFGYSLSAVECLWLNPPTLAELRHAFFDKDDENEFLCSKYRDDIFSLIKENSCGEWTSTFIQQSEKGYPHIILINRPSRIYINKSGQLCAKYNKTNSFHITSPPSGWVLKYDIETGWPLQTSNKMADAQKIFGHDASYFDIPDSINGLGSVCCSHSKTGKGPFHIYAGRGPCIYDSSVGMRSCSITEHLRI